MYARQATRDGGRPGGDVGWTRINRDPAKRCAVPEYAERQRGSNRPWSRKVWFAVRKGTLSAVRLTANLEFLEVAA